MAHWFQWVNWKLYEMKDFIAQYDYNDGVAYLEKHSDEEEFVIAFVSSDSDQELGDEDHDEDQRIPQMNGNGRAAIRAAVVVGTGVAGVDLRVMGAAAVPVVAVMMTVAIIHVIRLFDQRKSFVVDDEDKDLNSLLFNFSLEGRGEGGGGALHDRGGGGQNLL